MMKVNGIFQAAAEFDFRVAWLSGIATVCCLLFACPDMRAQSSSEAIDLDSLWSVWNDSDADVRSRAEALGTVAWEGNLFSRPDSALVLAEMLFRFCDSNGFFELAGNALNTEAVAYYVKGDFKQAVTAYERTIAYAEAKSEEGVYIAALGNLGIVLQELGDHSRAMECYMKSLSYHEQEEQRSELSGTLNNIASLYLDLGDLDNGMLYMRKALDAAHADGDLEDIALTTGNIGEIHLLMGQADTALVWLSKALEMSEPLGDGFRRAQFLMAVGDVLLVLNRPHEAIGKVRESILIAEQVGDTQGISRGQTSLARCHLLLGQHREATEVGERALSLARETGSVSDLVDVAKVLYEGYSALGSYRKALAMHEFHILMRDSLTRADSQREVIRLEMQYDFERKEALARAEEEKRDALAKEEIRRKNLQRNASVGGLVLMVLLAGVFLVQRNRIGKEKERSEELLLNILPEETAKELKEKGEAEARLINEVTVLFTDFKGFTAMSEQLSPKDLVKDLHLCFSLFDQICENNNIEKIKTIGDAYMAAGGLPTPNTTHAHDVVKAALEMAQVVEEGKAKKIAAGLPYFEVRIGIHTGPVVAGIVGIKKFQYDIWGDTVNTASRMESSGEVGKVNISEATYALVKDDFNCTFRGEIEAKGKGKLGMWFVASKQT
jgi:adenylate cyclase